MPVVVLANPKGGVGKSTLSSNVAGFYASRGHAVMLGDCDKQQSSRLWLGLRPSAARAISTWESSGESQINKPPKGTTHAVLDTPAGLHGWRYKDVIRVASHVLVPLQPSIFDIYATQPFLEELKAEQAKHKFALAVVGMRVDARTKAADQLAAFCTQANLPVLCYLRDTQNYVQLAARGLSLWDVGPSRVAKDLEQWAPVCEWLNQ
jgi:chromosome partitioning protein